MENKYGIDIFFDILKIIEKLVNKR